MSVRHYEERSDGECATNKEHTLANGAELVKPV
ncbi:MAG: hypothetical protein ACI9CF_000429 [Candidatus Omnitrophota bacterium]|jgi:hypothetical protein